MRTRNWRGIYRFALRDLQLTKAALIAVLMNFAAMPAVAEIVDSLGFEPPDYAQADLQGQQGWFKSGAAPTTAVVQDDVVFQGDQALEVTKAALSGTDSRWAVPVKNAPTGRFITIDWDMRVTGTGATSGFGPFFGVESYDADVQFGLLGSLGVDATTGEILYQQEDSGIFVSTGAMVTFDDWFHFRILLDFEENDYSVFVNDLAVPLATNGFVDRSLGLDNFSDADIAAIASAGDFASQNRGGTAYFDNFLVTDGFLGLLADYDLDGDVDAADYDVWTASYGDTGIFPADGNFNGTVDAADYTVWRDNLGGSVTGSVLGASSATVPEPTALLLLAIGAGFGALGWRR